MAVATSTLGKDALVNCARTSMSSKLIGSESKFFSEIVVDAVTAVKQKQADGPDRYPIKAINVLKSHG